MKLNEFDFRIWIDSFYVINGIANNVGKYVNEAYMKQKEFNIAMGLVKFYDKDKEKIDDVEFFTYDLWNGKGGFNHGVSDELEIELWSGFCDKDGKKIYENDILAFLNDFGGIEYYDRVEYEGGRFYLQGIDHPTRKGIDGLNVKGCKIVGNIHETKELIGVGKSIK